MLWKRSVSVLSYPLFHVFQSPGALSPNPCAFSPGQCAVAQHSKGDRAVVINGVRGKEA